MTVISHTPSTLFPTVKSKILQTASSIWCVFGLGPSTARRRLSPNYQENFCTVIFNFTGILGALKGVAVLRFLSFRP